MDRTKRIILFLMVFSVVSCNSEKKFFTIESPSKKLKTVIDVRDGKITYSLIKSGGDSDTVVLPFSPLGIEREDAGFFADLKVDSLSQIREISEEYEMLSGKQKHLSWQANEASLALKNRQGKRMNIVFRVFDQGLAFRYVFPEQSTDAFKVLSEKTAFNIPENAKGWMSPYEPSNGYGQPGYEKDYFHARVGDVSPDSIGWAFPLLFKTDHHWLLISESGLDDNYCGSHVDNEAGSSLYYVTFPEANERYSKGEVTPSSTLPWQMPWRFIVVGESVADVYESSMVYHLAEPCKLEDTSWIKPGRSSWEWWSSTSGRKVENLKSFIDLAAEMDWEYSLIDGGWPRMPEGSVEKLVAYAHSKKVDLNIWYNSGGRRDTTQKDEDFVVFNQESRDQEFSKIASMGIKGIKVDFFASDKQNTIQLYLDILRDAAKYKLLVNFHGCTLPRGWIRTYPNLLTMEAIKGAECYRYSKSYPEMAARFNTVAAVVRGAIGPTDYTPVTITNNKYPRLTTLAHELALAVVYESGIIHFADRPEGYRNLPEEARQFLKVVPAAWDETRLLSWVPGELFVVARKKEGKWYIAGINGKNALQEVSLKFPEPLNNAVFINEPEETKGLTASSLSGNTAELKIVMQPRGGFVIF